MKKLYTLFLFIFFSQTEEPEPPFARYKLEILGDVGFSGSTCGSGITGGLQ